MSSRVVEVVEQAIAAGAYMGAAVGVTVGGQVVLEHYAGEAAPGTPASAESIWPLASISKCFTAAMAMRLIDRGDLGLETRVADVIPRFRGDGREEIRLRHLLGHTSGLRYESPMLEELLLAKTPLAAIVEDAIAAPPLFPAGTRFTYSDDAYLLAGQLVQVLAGDPFSELVQSLVIDDMGLGSTWVRPPLAVHDRIAQVRGVLAEGTDGAMYNSAYGLALGHPAFGVVSSLRDMLRFAAHFAPGGPRIHREASIALLSTPQADLHGCHPLWPELGDDVAIGWGLAFEVQIDGAPATLSRNASIGAFGHPGASGCRIIVDPATATIVVVLTNSHLHGGLAAWRTRLDAVADAAFEDARAIG
ncbi:MAG: serine hydrolase domain-containing protein [Chloroflexota bacterium]